MTEQITMSDVQFQGLLESDSENERRKFFKICLSANTVVEKRVFEGKKPLEKQLKDPSASTVSVRCRYCKVFGHSIDECKKLTRKAIDKSEPTRSKRNQFPNICGTPGYVRSKCPKCNVSKYAFINFSEFSVNAISPSPRPIVFIDVFNSRGFGILHTGAKQIVASRSLYQVLKENNKTFVRDRVVVKLADGSNTQQDVMVTTVNVLLKNRVIPTKLIILANSQVQSTLLEIEFMQNSEMVIDVAQGK
ncbi:hypothetical protein RN001_009081 [Aquatica leii]|uniref:Uncharacterized protein n=1 Tax=Aquatica leii TaxID=1421715 RepID=A0AAN7Q257_9COLE|nr:hypothetical protein RN001_009081 [Aquatica leii]